MNRTRRNSVLLSLLWMIAGLFTLFAGGQAPPDGAWILKKADENLSSGSKVILSEIVIHGRRGSRSLRIKSYVQGTERSFSEYLDPPRERGIKMLKLGDQLWTYYPGTDRTILIAGHMLRQSVMGSDLSYEDIMEDPVLTNIYAAKVEAEEELQGRPCWLLALTAKAQGVAYHLRKIWVDKQRFVVLKEERYARSGKLLKTSEIQNVRLIQGRWVPERIIFRDALKQGGGTEFFVESMEFDAVIPDHIFNKASLRK